MRILGNLELAGLGFFKNARLEQLAEDPAAPTVGQIWYNSEDGVYRGFDGTTVITFGTQEDVAAIAADLARTNTGAGLSANGEYTAPTETGYLDAATSLFDADMRLDVAIRAVQDAVDAIGNVGEEGIGAIVQELAATQVGAGLDEDGGYVINASGHYIADATSLSSADDALDAAVHSLSLELVDQADDIEEVRITADGALARSGGTMAGDVNFNSHRLTGLAAPQNASDAATMGYVDSAIAGLDFQADVMGVQRDAEFVAEQTLGNRYIVTDVAALDASFGDIDGVVNNDIVEFNGTEFVVVYSVASAGPGAISWNRDQNTFFYFGDTSWNAFGGLAGTEAGSGLVKNGNVFSVRMGAGIKDTNDQVGIDYMTDGGLFLSIDGVTESNEEGAQLAIRLDGEALAISTAGLTINDGGVNADHIAAAALGNGLVGGDGTAISLRLATDSGLLLDENGLAFDASSIEGFLSLEGGTLTGSLVLAADPIEALEAATKQYVDAVRTDLEAALEGSTFVYEGDNSAAEHVVTHNIGSRYCNVTVIDSSDKVIIPDSITFDDANSLTVGFASAITCRVVVTGRHVAAV